MVRISSGLNSRVLLNLNVRCNKGAMMCRILYKHNDYKSFIKRDRSSLVGSGIFTGLDKEMMDDQIGRNSNKISHHEN